METAIAVRDREEYALPQKIEAVLVQGDLSKLTTEERVAYYRAICASLKLNPLSRPFDYITLSGKLTLYAKRDATDQLRKNHNVSVEIVGRERLDDLYTVTARATLPNGRTDEEIGVVNILGLKGEALANALMKATTKAKRRVTLSIVGLGMLDETEVETMPHAVYEEARTRQALPPANVDTTTGEIIEPNRATVHVEPPAAAPPKLTRKDAETGYLDALERAAFLNALHVNPEAFKEFSAKDPKKLSNPDLMGAWKALAAFVKELETAAAESVHAQLELEADAAMEADRDPFASEVEA